MKQICHFERSVAMTANVGVLCAVGDFGNGTFNIPHKPIRGTNVQLTMIATIAQNTCYMKCRLIYDKAQLEH